MVIREGEKLQKRGRGEFCARVELWDATKINKESRSVAGEAGGGVSWGPHESRNFLPQLSAVFNVNVSIDRQSRGQTLAPNPYGGLRSEDCWTDSMWYGVQYQVCHLGYLIIGKINK